MTFAPAVAIFVTFASAVRWADSTLRMAEEIKKAINGIESQLAAELTRATGNVPSRCDFACRPRRGTGCN